MDSFWQWVNQTYIPAIYSNVNYANQDMPDFSTMDGLNYVVGATRLRQVRVKKGQ